MSKFRVDQYPFTAVEWHVQCARGHADKGEFDQAENHAKWIAYEAAALAAALHYRTKTKRRKSP
jgi:hypothetical protein